jgi:hypothetical protein
LVNAEFTLTIQPDYRIARLECVEELLTRVSDSDAGRLKLLRSLITESTLRQAFGDFLELLPGEEGVRVGETWKRRHLVEDALGTYDTARTFTYQGKKGMLDRIAIVTAQQYQPPKAAKDRELPFKVVRADLKSTAGKGVVLFDRELGRVASAEEELILEGTMVVEFAGQESTVTLSQRQRTTTQVTDTNPLK